MCILPGFTCLHLVTLPHPLTLPFTSFLAHPLSPLQVHAAAAPLTLHDKLDALLAQRQDAPSPPIIPMPAPPLQPHPTPLTLLQQQDLLRPTAVSMPDCRTALPWCDSHTFASQVRCIMFVRGCLWSVSDDDRRATGIFAGCM